MIDDVVEKGAPLAPLRISRFGHGKKDGEDAFGFVAEFLTREFE